MQTATCPPSEQLKAYLSGKLDLDTIESLALHLQDCVHCGQTATQMEQEPDTLVELLQTGMPPLASSPETANRASTNISSSIFPKILGQYELQSRLGVGGMGAVYLARHLSLDKHVAIKLLPALPAQNAEFVARFQREMRAAGKLEHPAIVRTTDAGERQGIHFLVMEAIDGLNLSRIARAEGRMAIADACEVVRQAALGLSHAHEKGIVHRDIKPSNLMLDSVGQVRILDFGLAQIGFWESGSAEITTVGQMMGTLDYMAPEQAERSGAVDYRADLYSLGSTLFRLLTGRAPLAAAPNLTPIEKLRLLATHRPPKLRSLRADAPDELGKIVDAMLAREPASRPASAIHAAELIEPFCAGADLVGLLKRARSRPQTEEPQFEMNPLLQRDLMELVDDSHSLVGDSAGQSAYRGEADRQDQRYSESGFAPSVGKRVGSGWLTRLTLVGFAGLLCAGFWLVLETSKGQLVIDSQANVQVKILQVDGEDRKDVDELQIEPGTRTTRLRSGQYEIILDAASDSFSVTNESFTIRNGQTVVARIMPRGSNAKQSLLADGSSVDPVGGAVGASSLTELVYDGQTLDTWLKRLKFERNPDEITKVLTAIGALVDVSLRNVLEQPIVEFIVTTGHSRSDWGVAASWILMRCCGQDYYDILGKLLPRLNSNEERLQFLEFSECLFVNVPVEHIQDVSLFLDETQRLLAVDSPNVASKTATILRYIADGMDGKPATNEIQSKIVQQLLNAPLVTNENFWLNSPYSYYVKRYTGGICNVLAVSLTGCKPLNDQVVQRGLSVLVDHQSSDQAVTQAAAVLRTFVESGMELSDNEKSILAEGLKRHLLEAVGTPETTLLDVKIPRAPWLNVAAPILSFGQFRGQNPFSNEANKLIVILNLIQVVGLQNSLSNELDQLRNVFSELPLHKNRFATSLEKPSNEAWNNLQEANKPQENRPMEIGQDLNSATIYLQSGLLLGMDAKELLARFGRQLPADLDRLVNRLLDAIETAHPRHRSGHEAFKELYNLAQAEIPKRAVEIIERYIALQVSSDHTLIQEAFVVWQRAASNEFPASFVRVLNIVNQERQSKLLTTVRLVLGSFQVTQPDELEPLLKWCDEIMVKCSGDSPDDLCWSAISLLQTLTSKTEKVSLECQQQVVDRLESYSWLNDENFWIQPPLTGTPWSNIGPAMRQAILQRAIQVLQPAVDANASIDGNLECHALAAVLQGLPEMEQLPEDLPLAFEDFVRNRLAAASKDPIGFSRRYFYPDELRRLAVPQLAEGTLNDPNVENDVGIANPIILILNILSQSARNEDRRLSDKCVSELETLHKVLEELEIKGRRALSGVHPKDWSFWMKQATQTDLILHTWYMQTGVLLGKDLETLRQRPEQLLMAEKQRRAREVQPGDTLAIHIPGLLPRSGDPPVLQAGENPPVVGFPVPVSVDGMIQLPLLKPMSVKDLGLPSILANIEQAYSENRVFSSDQALGITVQFLSRADHPTELRNITGSSTVVQPN